MRNPRFVMEPRDGLERKMPDLERANPAVLSASSDFKRKVPQDGVRFAFCVLIARQVVLVGFLCHIWWLQEKWSWSTDEKSKKKLYTYATLIIANVLG